MEYHGMKKFYNDYNKLESYNTLIYRLSYLFSLISFSTIMVGCANNHMQASNGNMQTSYNNAPPPPNLDQNTPATQINTPQNENSSNNGSFQQQAQNNTNTAVQAKSTQPSTKNGHSTPNKQPNNNGQYANSFQRIEEQRGYGGTITEVKVNNRGYIPPYYLNSQQNQYDGTNNPDKLMTPSWKISW
jgi:hypothetical protein